MGREGLGSRLWLLSCKEAFSKVVIDHLKNVSFKF